MKVFVVSALLLTIFIMSKTVYTQNFDVPIPCSGDDECKRLTFLPSSAECRGGFCICYEGGIKRNCTAPRTMLASTKTSGPIIGHVCKHSTDCRFDNGFCNTTVSQCLCKHRYVPNADNNKCLPVVNSIGGTCEDSKQCLNLLPYTTCSQTQCVCIEGFHHAENVCFHSKGIGENCEKPQECSHIDHAECNNQNICACSIDTVFDSDSKRCLALPRELSNQQCTDSNQCIPILGKNAQCIENYCRCPSSTHFVSRLSKCVDTKHVDESCETDDNCYQDELSTSNMAIKCVDNTCTCTDGFIKKENKCVTSAGSIMISKMSVGLLVISLLIIRL